MGLQPWPVEIDKGTKWKDNEWRLYLNQLMFTGYNVFTCAYIEISLNDPQSLNKIEEWIKTNKEKCHG